MTPSMPYEHFKVLVKCQRKKGVRLIQGCDNGRATREFVSATADVVYFVTSLAIMSEFGGKYLCDLCNLT